jgi:subtilisin family serine protease
MSNQYILKSSDGYTYLIRANGVRIGRNSSNDVVLNNPAISRFHASIIIHQDKLWVKDENSKIGVIVNSHKVYQQQEIFPGDIIQIGTWTFQLIQGSKLSTVGIDNKERKNKLVFIGMFAVFIVIFMIAVGGGGQQIKYDPPIPSNKISWSEGQLKVDAFPGTSLAIPGSFTSSKELTDKIIFTSSELENLIKINPDTIIEGDEYLSYDYLLIIDIPKAQQTGIYNASIHVQEKGKSLDEPKYITVNVIDSSLSAISPEVVAPSEDRLTTDKDGQWLVSDEIIVGLKFDTIEPEQRIKDIAMNTGANVYGSVPQTLTYQFVFDVNTLDELEAKRLLIEDQTDVEFSSHSYLFEDVSSKFPNDNEYEPQWNENNPSGNNYHLEMINALSAWDITTGDEKVNIGVIDSGLDYNHGDLDDNIVHTNSHTYNKKNHGTHVSGIICAEGNNGKGVSGVMWDCSLHFYSHKYISIGKSGEIKAQEQMVKAIDDGNRIVNNSWGVITSKCDQPIPANTLEMVSEANNIFSQAIVYAQKQNKDVLWIFSAGNECRDLKYASPASLTVEFPMNTISVASVDESENLSLFSNYGDLVTVAAPGEDVFSTIPSTNLIFKRIDHYDIMSGTSMAAPIVTGIAGLILSEHPDFTATQIKQCIIAGANSGGKDVKSNDPKDPLKTKGLKIVSAVDAINCQGDIPLPEKVDLVFSLDLTGSMKEELLQVKENITKIIDDLRLKASPSTDFRFALVSYEDYPGYFDGTRCGSGYQEKYGLDGSKPGGDKPFRIDQVFTTDMNILASKIYDLELGDGEDDPEAYGRAFYEIANNINFRPNSLKLIINFGDSIPHDTNLNEDIDDIEDILHVNEIIDTGIDPGPNNQIDCNGDDIDFQDDAINDLVKKDIRLLHIDSSGLPELEIYWRTWTSKTGGAFAAINSDGTIPSGIDLSGLIMDLLRLTPRK